MEQQMGKRVFALGARASSCSNSGVAPACSGAPEKENEGKTVPPIIAGSILNMGNTRNLLNMRNKLNTGDTADTENLLNTEDLSITGNTAAVLDVAAAPNVSGGAARTPEPPASLAPPLPRARGL